MPFSMRTRPGIPDSRSYDLLRASRVTSNPCRRYRRRAGFVEPVVSHMQSKPRARAVDSAQSRR